MKKHKAFFRKYGIFVFIYTDDDLADCDKIFAEMKKYLKPQIRAMQLKLHIIEDFLSGGLQIGDI
ncbi:unnamed protein product [marine sediment metagenome]|uniref:Uncharacterized protein n=1 Tax=marine sediment metagenome TaxID=412755 RepID=X1NLF7_9ZZZZ